MPKLRKSKNDFPYCIFFFPKIFGNIKNNMEIIFHIFSLRKFSSPWLSLVIAIFFGLASDLSFAQTCTGSNETITVTMPTSITVPRNATSPTPLLTGWITSSDLGTNINCTVPSGRSVAPIFNSQLIYAGITVNNSNGVTFNVWKTNVPGIGIAMGYQPTFSGNTFCNGLRGWAMISTTPLINEYYCFGPSSPYTMNYHLQFALVKIGPVTPGVISGGVVAISGWAANGNSTTGTPGAAQPGIQKSYYLTSTTIETAACETPDVTVNMGKPMLSTFTGVGHTTPTVAFDVSINACPAGGLTKVQYQFIPVNAVVDANNGLLALSSTSTATGIALQLKDGSDAPLKFNTLYTLAGYSSAAGGSYKVPLKAAYRQTAATVTPGRADAALTFTMIYQ
jgi:major type 1 subunit fimbrin (pilin)